MSEVLGSSGLGFYGQDFFVIKTNEDLVEESIIRLLSTNFRERVGKVQWGGDLKSNLFEQLDDATISQIETNLKDMIELYEPRATISSLTLTADKDNSSLSISVGFKYVGAPKSDDRFINLTVSA